MEATYGIDGDSTLRALAAERKLHELEEDLSLLRQELKQAQKMDAVGRMVGGVVHDFNNVLAVIMGNVELAINEPGSSANLQEELREILHAAERAAALTNQLLAFMRKQVVVPKIFEINAAVAGAVAMLRRLVGARVRLEWRPGGEAGWINMQPSQIDQILTNLCVNARDAIGEKGTIMIETGREILGEGAGKEYPDVAPGDYVWLAVTDDGSGMDRETQGKIFEPFFTTKSPGQGTGLGLAVVRNLVRQNNGWIAVRSAVGAGTCIRIAFPRLVVPDEEREREDHGDMRIRDSSCGGR